MSASDSNQSTRLKVGIFTILGIALIGAVTVYVNDKPYWWKGCQLVHISVDDAMGLKAKSPVRSLGIEIGYLETIELSETHVTLGICITANVEVLPSTRAYIVSQGFLGDKFVELKPVRYLGPKDQKISFFENEAFANEAYAEPVPPAVVAKPSSAPVDIQQSEPISNPHPQAAKSGGGKEREIPVGENAQDVQHLVNRVDSLVNEMTSLTDNLKQAINPQELRSTMKQLNKTLESASRTLSPEGGLNQTAQRTLEKLEDAIEQLQDQLTRINKGQGSVGMILNDPSYAQEIREAIRNVNRLLTKVGNVRFVVDIGAEEIWGYNGARGWFRLAVWPNEGRYYLLGFAIDPRGKRTQQIVTTSPQSGPSIVTTATTVEPTAPLLTGMIGKLFFHGRLDVAVGALNGDGTMSVAFRLGPNDNQDALRFQTDIYSHSGATNPIDARLSLDYHPISNAVYLRAGLESFIQVNGQLPFFAGAGISFDDEDIKVLFALR